MKKNYPKTYMIGLLLIASSAHQLFAEEETAQLAGERQQEREITGKPVEHEIIQHTGEGEQYLSTGKTGGKLARFRRQTVEGQSLRIETSAQPQPTIASPTASPTSSTSPASSLLRAPSPNTPLEGGLTSNGPKSGITRRSSAIGGLSEQGRALTEATAAARVLNPIAEAPQRPGEQILVPGRTEPAQQKFLREITGSIGETTTRQGSIESTFKNLPQEATKNINYDMYKTETGKILSQQQDIQNKMRGLAPENKAGLEKLNKQYQNLQDKLMGKQQEMQNKLSETARAHEARTTRAKSFISNPSAGTAAAVPGPRGSVNIPTHGPSGHEVHKPLSKFVHHQPG